MKDTLLLQTMRTTRFVLMTCILAIAGIGSGNAQTNTTEKTAAKKNSTTCTMDIDGKNWPTMQNPTQDDIRAAIASLGDGPKDPGFLILRRDAANMIQLNWDEKSRYSFNLQEGDEKHQFLSTRQYSAADALQLLIAYVTNKSDWKKPADWKQE